MLVELAGTPSRKTYSGNYKENLNGQRVIKVKHNKVKRIPSIYDTLGILLLMLRQDLLLTRLRLCCASATPSLTFLISHLSRWYTCTTPLRQLPCSGDLVFIFYRSCTNKGDLLIHKFGPTISDQILIHSVPRVSQIIRKFRDSVLSECLHLFRAILAENTVFLNLILNCASQFLLHTETTGQSLTKRLRYCLP